MTKLISLSLIIISSSLFADGKYLSKESLYINKLSTSWHGSGLTIDFKKPIKTESGLECRFANTVFLKSEHKLFKEIVSIALSAKLANKPLRLLVEEECFGDRYALQAVTLSD